MASSSPVCIVVVDDHPILRLALAEIIKARPEFLLCAETDSASDGIKAIQEFEPDIVIVDIRLEESSGFDVLQASYTKKPKFLVFSALKDPVVVRRAFDVGASGYVVKSSLTPEVLDGIQALIAGENYIGSEITLDSAAEGEPAGVNALTNRELEVYELIGEGLGPSQIAARLGLSVKTIETHKENIKLKLDLSSGNELLRHAMQWSLGVGKSRPD